MIPPVIQCADHSFAPWAIVCIHLINNPLLEWHPIEVDDNREVENDWACDECYAKHLDDNDQVNDLMPICIHCLRKLRNEV